MRHGREGRRDRGLRIAAAVMVFLAVATATFAGASAWSWWRTGRGTAQSSASRQSDGRTPALDRAAIPGPDDSPEATARRLVAAMTPEERVGQLVMAPMNAGDDPSTLRPAIADRHVGSILLLGNWTGGTDGVRRATDALQAMAPQGRGLLVSADQEGGQVQHLRGAGFDTMPSGVEQGRMDTDSLRRAAAGWGGQLASAGVNTDLAPVVGTVRTERSANAPVGALDRDFGLDPAGNAAHGAAFVEGMRDAGVQTAVKHYPGLGAVTGNTDFTSQGITDTTTTLDGEEAGAFGQVIGQVSPAMVMVSLATYERIDPASPAAFSSAVIDGGLRQRLGYQGVVISDSLSAAAVSSVPSDQLGVRLVEAGGDLACLGDPALVTPVLDGLLARVRSDPAFAQLATRAAERVMTLKVRMGLAG